MTIDDAIAHAREKAKEKRKEMQCKTCKLFSRSDVHPLQGYCRKNEFRSIEIDSWSKVCSGYVPKEMCKCAEEHERLAEWLEELKEYQQYGTPDGYGSALKAYDDCYFEKEEISNELQEYRQLGALEEVRAAVEKQRAKKPIKSDDKICDLIVHYRCPCCGKYFGGRGIHHVILFSKERYCNDCGQHIDWSEEE